MWKAAGADPETAKLAAELYPDAQDLYQTYDKYREAGFSPKEAAELARQEIIQGRNAAETSALERMCNEGGTPPGYYQDVNGRWHRPNGQFASNAEVGITSPTKVSTGSHGNSLSDPRTNYGYVLVDRDTNEILKFGETIHPTTRYSQSYLDANNANMMILEQGNKLDIHLWQHDMNEYYFDKYKEYPPLNSGGW